MHTRRSLDGLALDVELVLISVVQGVALVILAEHGGRLLMEQRWNFLPFALTALLYILVFWSAAIIHSLSFVSWPLDLVHNLLYFCAGLLEALTFRHIDHPTAWFAYSMAFFVVIEALYFYDFGLIRSRRAEFAPEGPEHHLYAHMVAQQRLEMFMFVPIGMLFNGIAAWTVARAPATVMPFAIVQLLLAATFLGILLHSFDRRQLLIGACATGDANGAALE